MRHLDDGQLRRLHDDPLAIAEPTRHHYEACSSCQARFAVITNDARQAQELFDIPLPAVNHAQALMSIQRQLVNDQASPRTARNRQERTSPMHRPFVKAVAAFVAALVLVSSVVFTPVGSLAQSFITIFEPQSFQAVPMTVSDLKSLRNLPDLSSYGTVSATLQPKIQEFSTSAAVAVVAGFRPLLPSALPALVPSPAKFSVMSRSSASFTFSAEKARAAAATHGKPIPPMPTSLNGSLLQTSIGPIVVATYGGNINPASFSRARHTGIRERRAPGLGDLPRLIIVQAPRPSVTSTGASVADIENYLLAQPGVTPSLAAKIRAIGDPSSTLPIPLPINRATAKSVGVQGVRGLAIGDNTGIGSGVIWQKDGKVYGVAGTLTMDEVLTIANSMR